MTDALLEQLKNNIAQRLDFAENIAVSTHSNRLNNEEFVRHVISVANFLSTEGNEKTTVVVRGSKPNVANLVACYAALLSGKTFCCLSDINYQRLLEGKLDNFPSYIDFSVINYLEINSSTSFKNIHSLATRSVDNPAYIVFTSGSTGRPKGIVINRKSFLIYLYYINNLIGTRKKKYFIDIFSSPLYFDNAIFNIAIMCGSTCHTHTVDASEFSFNWKSDPIISRCCKFYLVYGAPSIIKLFARKGIFENLFAHSLGTIGFGGEGYSWEEIIDDLSMLNKEVEIINFYGPSECTCMCSHFKFKPDTIEELFKQYKHLSPYPPLGTIFPYFKWALEKKSTDNNPAIKNKSIDNNTGELNLFGEALMDNYLINNGDKPINEYKTGDIVSIDNNLIFFKGRIDNQYKINGIRIELEEIDAVLNGISYIKNSAVIAVEDRFKYLVAFISIRNKTYISDSELRKIIKQRLGSKKCPAVFVRVEQIPLNLNGKVDRKLLESNYNLKLAKII